MRMVAIGKRNNNEMANEAARADSIVEWCCEAKDRITEYSEVLTWYRLVCGTMQPPRPGLARSVVVTFQEVQTGSILSPVLLKHVCFCGYISDLCRVCGSERATAAYILWDSEQNPKKVKTVTTIPPWLAAVAGSEQREERALQWLSAALEKHHPSESGGARYYDSTRAGAGAEQASGSGEVRVPTTMASSSSQRGYDPEEMAWSTISHSGNPTSAPSEPIRNEN
ncbi:hypothetical protein HPB50_021583 [Hyalomma asiaticum]|uniref:Uncharacterized protein n=1 Tax=Hyalomma asiaticum TaxID=266040 RepID=A0ACB7TEY5_HYAAI|nr:hypothetical protein HPB50_021583 [Hyalomma asiaticum]